jgi:hypothetical protein
MWNRYCMPVFLVIFMFETYAGPLCLGLNRNSCVYVLFDRVIIGKAK